MAGSRDVAPVGGPAVLDVRLHPVGKRRPVVWDPERLLTVERKAV